MSNLQIFNFESQEVRFVGTANDPWWVAADVCAVLEVRNSRDALARLDDDEKGVAIIYTPGGNQEMSTINESGLYSLILTSRKPQAKRFKKWVTAEVIPSIRKTGNYTIAPAAPTPPTPTPQQISEVFDLTLGQAGLDPRLIAGVKLNAIAKLHPALAPAAELAKPSLQIAVEDGLLSPTQLAQILSESTGANWTNRKVNKLLLEQGFQKHNPDGKSPAYLPTDKGEEYSKIILDTATGRDKTIQSLRWFRDVLEALKL
ncbi:prophage antirepressor (plasmid) [Cylindrospermum sp. NIES-4074]|nr:prophage antirepressor [Cylindrospermum sp. NIES-4074]